jgi:hypothetical protein|tara:strand:- start:357 stop:674 length:318 start_codon:yes stop_codon:yes gene_type:complete
MTEKEFRDTVEAVVEVFSDDLDYNCREIEIPEDTSGPYYMHIQEGCALCCPQFSMIQKDDKLTIQMPDQWYNWYRDEATPDQKEYIVGKFSERLPGKNIEFMAMP